MAMAGHIFGGDGCCSCGKRPSDITFAAYDPYWVGQPNIAHTGDLTLHEQGEIAEYTERLQGCLKNVAEA